MAAIKGTPGDDTIFGTKGSDTIQALSGNDTVHAFEGNDTISGGGGDDVLSGGQGNDIINGGAGDDIINGGKGLDTVVYAGVLSDYSFSVDKIGRLIITDNASDHNYVNGAGHTVPLSNQGTDHVQNIELFNFVDYSTGTNHVYTVADLATLTGVDFSNYHPF
jgi:Ca2+-binding RTX toxin-like protein